jgi:hypothetical protein
MKKTALLSITAIILLFSSCEVEYRGERQVHHFRGYEHHHHPTHHDEYSGGYHHDRKGGEIIIVP